MADSINQNGLGLSSSVDIPIGTTIPVKDQTDFYAANVHLPANKYNEKNTYEANAPEDNIGTETQSHNVFTIGSTYEDQYNKNGSSILLVNGTQVGNEEKAQIDDFANLDKYLTRPSTK